MTTDLTSVGYVALQDSFFYVGQHSFMPEARAKEKMATDKVPYDLWRDMGYFTYTSGETVDYLRAYHGGVAAENQSSVIAYKKLPREGL